MKLKEKMKRFWNLDVHNHEGFTLVELIIVIAILAILSSVAVAGYSAYIEKANVAADEALLYEINLAFQTACIEAGVDITTLNNTTAKMPINDDGTIDMDSILPTNPTALTNDVRSTFARYFEVSNAKFKVYTQLWFGNGIFSADPIEAGYTPYSYGGGTIYLSASDIAMLKDSAFMNANGLGISNLLTKVDSVVGFGVGMMADENGNLTDFGDLIYDEDYEAYLMDVLGVSGDLNAYADKMAEMVDKLQEMDPSLTDDEAWDQIMVNNAVLYAANNTTNKEALLSILQSSDPKKSIVDAMGGSNGDVAYGLGQASAAYGMYTAYVYALPLDYSRTNDDGTVTTRQDLIDATANPVDILNGLKDPGFMAYMQTEQAEKDLDAYLAAMNMINASTSDSDAVSNLLVNGFTDEDLIDLLQQATSGN